MNFNCIPTLQHITSVKVVLLLFQERDFEILLNKDLMMPYDFEHFEKQRHELWKRIESIAENKFKLLPCPVRTNLVRFIRPMHLEVVRWLIDEDLSPQRKGFGYNYRKLILWKSDGTIDREGTAKKFVLDEKIDIRDRFIMACNYFFEEEICDLWKIVKVVGIKNTSLRGVNAAVNLWMDYLKLGSVRPLNDVVNEYMVADSVHDSDISLNLFPYFHLLSLESKRSYYSLLCQCGPIHRDNFRLCLCQMEEAEQNKLLESEPSQALMRFLDWPYQALFIKIANKVQWFLLPADYETILNTIVKYYILYGYDYIELFQQFWSIVPNEVKSIIMSNKTMSEAFTIILKCHNRALSVSIVELIAKHYYV